MNEIWLDFDGHAVASVAERRFFAIRGILNLMGKNFSCNNTGKRKKSDFYETPFSMTKQLLEVEKLEGTVLEPACGNGAISSIVGGVSYDIEKGFFNETKNYGTIITNPPYSLAFEFIKKAKTVATEKIIFLLPLSYLHGKRRYDEIWNDKLFPLARIYVFTRYPMLGEKLREDGKYHTGMMVYAWFVWERNHIGNPEINWIDNDRYVLRK